MKVEQWQEIDRLFQIALERTPEARLAFLEQACSGDESLLREIEALLAAHEQAGSFIERPALEVEARALANEQGDSSATSLVGQAISHYRIIAALGSGGMGEVYLAQDTVLGRKVALKLLPSEFTRDAERVRRFQQEARAASALNHPNIITIYEIGQVDDRHFITTEFIDGETLRQRIARSQPQIAVNESRTSGVALGLGEVLNIAVQAADALAAAHEAGIVHRDIKPENIMLRRNGLVKVLDFGLVKLVEQRVAAASEAETRKLVRTETGMLMGTARYMSPEQAKGERVTARSDIFSFGVVLYELLTGEAAFRSASAVDTLHAVIHDEPAGLKALSQRVPAGVERVLRRCLEKEGERRYADGVELTAALKQAMESSRSTMGAPARAQHVWPSRQRRWWIGLAAVALLLVCGAVWLRLSRSGVGNASDSAAKAPAAIMKTVPLTTLSGVVMAPRFSPDGNQVAFSWWGEAAASEHNEDIYVKLIDGGTLLRLTSDLARDTSPVWSPDGHWISFSRWSDTERAIYMIPAIGGPERKLVSAHVAGGGGWTLMIDWSVDGTIVYADAAAPGSSWGLYRLSVETLETTQLTSPPANWFGDLFPASSPDGKLLAFVRRDAAFGDVPYLMPALGGEPKRLTFDNRPDRITGLAWTADGRSIVFASKRGGTCSLWRISASGGEPERLGVSGDTALQPAISRQGQRLAYVNGSFGTSSIWRLDLAASQGKAVSRTRLFSSSTLDGDPQLSPDGKKIVFSSERSGDSELWVCESDGSNPLQLTKLHSASANPYWSPDGRSIVFDSRLNDQYDIYVISANGGVPHRMTEDPSNDGEPSWSRDGHWIYFDSNRSGDSQIWKMPAEGGEAVQVTRQGGGVRPLESSDGRYVYYAKRSNVPGLWRVPAEGGEEELVLDRLRAGYWPWWTVVDKGIYFFEPEEKLGAAIEFYSFSTRRVTRVTAIEEMYYVDSLLSVTPDGRWMLLAQGDMWGGGSFLVSSNLMLVENFR